MEIPQELEAKLVHAAAECLKAADSDEYTTVFTSPTGRLLVDVRLLPLPMESKEVLRLYDEKSPGPNH
jgi:hypothetical protein